MSANDIINTLDLDKTECNVCKKWIDINDPSVYHNSSHDVYWCKGCIELYFGSKKPVK